MKRILFSLPLPLALILACDPASPEVESCAPSGYKKLILVDPINEVGPVEFRNGPPVASYIQTWDGKPIRSKEFAEAVLECEHVQDPTWLLTLSSYQPDATDDKRVVGLGGSALVGSPFWECMTKRWIDNDAQPL